jgi:Protein of unknown function (DUF2637)
VGEWLKRLAPQMVPGVIFSGLAVIVGVMAAVSYDHEYLLASRNGQAGWVSDLLPVSVDGLIVVASVAFLWGGAQKVGQLWRPATVLGVGVAATVSANLLASLNYWWLRPAVSAWSGIAIVAVADVGMWFVAARRKLAAPDEPQRAVNCSCPPLPLTLADALRLARAELMDRGEEYGEEKLAERFDVTRHKVRSALLSSTNGSGPHE